MYKNFFARLDVRHIVVFCVLAWAVLFLLGCGSDEPNPFEMHPSDITGGPIPDTSTMETIEAGGRYLMLAGGRGVAWALIAGLILGGPLSVMLVVPGLIFGRREMNIEGAFIFVLGLIYMALADRYHLDSLATAALLVNVIPGALLFIWGLFSSNEKVKLVLLVIPTIGMGLWFFFLALDALVKGFVFRPILTVIVIFVKLMIIGKLFGKK